MFYVHYEGETYKVAFKHEQRDVVMPTSQKQSSITEPRMVTTCSIYRMLGEDKLVAERGSICRPPDRFSREAGRKRAFARALWKLAPTMVIVKPDGMLGTERSADTLALREAFWRAYFGRKPTGMQLPMRDLAVNEQEDANALRTECGRVAGARGRLRSGIRRGRT